MSLLLSVAFICHLLAILTTLGFGLTYLLRRQFMPYHGVALKREWDAMPTAFQILVLALMRAVAAGALATALLSTVILLIPFRAGEVWAFWTLPASTLVLAGGALYAMRLVATNTPARPPYAPIMIAAALVMIGLVLSLCGRLAAA